MLGPKGDMRSRRVLWVVFKIPKCASHLGIGLELLDGVGRPKLDCHVWSSWRVLPCQQGILWSFGDGAVSGRHPQINFARVAIYDRTTLRHMRNAFWADTPDRRSVDAHLRPISN